MALAIPAIPKYAAGGVRSERRRGVGEVHERSGPWSRCAITFEVVDERRLVVGIHRRSALTEPQSLQQLPEASLFAFGSRVQPEVPNSFPDHLCRPGLHEVRGDACPHFQKTLRKTHTKKCASSRMVSRFSNCFQFRQHVSIFRDFLYMEFNSGQEVNSDSALRNKPMSL
jgi:hypothetical protein